MTRTIFTIVDITREQPPYEDCKISTDLLIESDDFIKNFGSNGTAEEENINPKEIENYFSGLIQPFQNGSFWEFTIPKGAKKEYKYMMLDRLKRQINIAEEDEGGWNYAFLFTLNRVLDRPFMFFHPGKHEPCSFVQTGDSWFIGNAKEEHRYMVIQQFKCRG